MQGPAPLPGRFDGAVLRAVLRPGKARPRALPPACHSAIEAGCGTMPYALPSPFPLVIRASVLTKPTSAPRQGSPTRLSQSAARPLAMKEIAQRRVRAPTGACCDKWCGAGRRRSAAETGAAEDRGCRSLASVAVLEISSVDEDGELLARRCAARGRSLSHLRALG